MLFCIARHTTRKALYPTYLLSYTQRNLHSSSIIMANYAKEQEIAVEAVRRASIITNTVFTSSISTLTKSDKSPVTVGDFSAQGIINAILQKYFPDDEIIGEEDADDLRQEDKKELKAKVVELVNRGLTLDGADTEALSEDKVLESIDKGNSKGGIKGRMWTLDPIDGTKGFLRGGQYAVCLALIVDGKVQLGVMGCPNLPVDKNEAKPKEGDLQEVESRKDLGVIFSAVRGKGAFQVCFIYSVRCVSGSCLYLYDVPLCIALNDIKHLSANLNEGYRCSINIVCFLL